MSKAHTPYAWEDWQLTAYLLGEVEPEVAAEIAAAAQQDPKLATQLQELSMTLNDVKALLSTDGTTAGDQAAMSALQANLVCKTESADCDQAPKVLAVQGEPEASQVVQPAPHFTWRRLATRWENWASLAGLVMIAVLLSQRPGTPSASEQLAGQPSVNQPASPSALAAKNSSSNTLDATVVREAWDQTSAPLVSLDASLPSRDMSVAASGPTQQANSGPADRAVALSAPALSAPAMPADALPAEGEASAGYFGRFGGGMNMGGASGMGGMMDETRGGMGMGGMGMGGAIAGEGGGMGGGAEGGMAGAGSAMAGMEFDASNPQRLRERDYLAVAAGGDRFTSFRDNDFLEVSQQPLSTFSIDVDTASYAKCRQYLLEHRQLPPPASVRIEEFINYFDYQYAGPQNDQPFAAQLAVTQCPWQPRHQLVRIALQAKQVESAQRPKANLVFLLDVSGSMDQPNKLPLVKETMRLLTYQLTENDKVAMVVYAGAAGCVLESTHGHEQDKILGAIERLSAGGSTNGGQGIELAYKLARENFIQGGINRVILCTDGDFNVGVTSTNSLVDLVKEQAASHVFLTVLGYGMGNTNDAMMEQIADRGNGLYGFVDSRREAERQMVKQLAGNLMTVAKDVKIQVEFNPSKVRSYRLIGYENRQLAAEDFNNDKKDAGEIGAGHRVTAIYELVPASESGDQAPVVDALRYQAVKSRPEPVAPVKLEGAEVSHELLAVKLRYKQPEGSESQLLTFPLEDKSVDYAEIDQDFRWAAAMAEFGMLLRRSPHKGNASWASLSQRARSALGNPVDTVRAETLEMINTASSLMGASRRE